jgi:hypothetical protein
MDGVSATTRRSRSNPERGSPRAGRRQRGAAIHTWLAVTPSSLHEFFVASAGVAGALIGLLFVAISVEHERLTAEDADQIHRVRAAAALTSFTNAFAISLFALVPFGGLGWTALVVGLIGLFFVVASLLSIRRVRRTRPVAMRDALFLLGLAVALGLQLYYAVLLISRSDDVAAAKGIAVLVIVCFLIGISRAWELIGGPSVGLGSEVRAIVHTHAHDDEGPGGAERPQREPVEGS